MDFRLLHPLLSYSQHNVVQGHCCSILWDLREPPESALHVDNLDKLLSFNDLTQFATNPPCAILRITCDVFPEEWPINVRRPEGVTVGDVLHTIYTVLNHRIKPFEWDRICEKQRGRIGDVFDHRCMIATQQQQCRANGVLRVDCLLLHTWFAGLSPSLDEVDSFILTLRRPLQNSCETISSV